MNRIESLIKSYPLAVLAAVSLVCALAAGV